MSKKKAKKNKEKNRIDDPQEIINSSPQPSKTNESIIIKWLKRIFSIQTLTVVATLAAAYFGYKTYSDNQPAQLCIEYDFLDFERNYDLYDDYELKTIEVNHSIKRIMVLLDERFFTRDLHLAPYDNKDHDDIHFNLPIPTIKNKSNKIINDLDVTIDFCPNFFSVDDDEKIDSKYIIQNIDTIRTGDKIFINYVFKYKEKLLYANSNLYCPVNHLYLKDDVNFDPEYSGTYPYDVSFTYTIKYNGLEKPICFDIDLFAYMQDSDFSSNLIDDYHASEEEIDDFLTTCYKEEALFKNHNTLVLIVLESTALIMDPIEEDISDEAFEKYKTDIISKVLLYRYK